MKGLEYLASIRKYCDYLERHITNVRKAFELVREKCSDMRFIWDDFCYHNLERQVFFHDESKFSESEFIAYTARFCAPKDFDWIDSPDFTDKAWPHHYANNQHHWENWTNISDGNPYAQEVACAHMVIDWLAMSFEFGDTPRQYYEANKGKILLPEWAVGFIYEIFERLDG